MFCKEFLIIKKLAFAWLCCFACSACAQDLSEHQWKSRILIVQTSDASSPEYQAQLAALDGQATALCERKIILYKVIRNTYQKISFQNTIPSASGTLKGTLQMLVKKNEAPFSVTLLGLDGGKKRQQKTTITAPDLYSIIDGMPMRRYEIKNKG